MKLGKKKEDTQKAKALKSAKLSNPNVNQTKRFLWLLVVMALAISAIWYVHNLGMKAQETISVAMFNKPIHKNEVITMDSMSEYKMLVGEFEKYAVKDNNGNYNRRIILWSEAPKAVGLYAAYPLHQDTLAMYRDLIVSRVDNSDNVMYTFPGKDIVPLTITGSELKSFKTFLQPGDRINIEVIYMEQVEDEIINDYGMKDIVKIDVFKTESLFKDILIADLMNDRGDSILDIYTSYNQLTTWQQAAYDKDPSFIKSTEPASLLVALSPEEKERYFYFLAKSDVSFRATLPQRIE